MFALVLHLLAGEGLGDPVQKAGAGAGVGGQSGKRNMRLAQQRAVAAQAEGDWDSANLSLMRRSHARATALPTSLVEATTRANSACEKIWREAKAQADFAMVRGALTEVVALQRETAAALSAALGMAPYDALMDGYQRGVTAADVEPVFAAYEAFLADALPRAEEIQARRGAALPLSGPFPVTAQKALCQALSARIGLEYDHARLDESLHPFCGALISTSMPSCFMSSHKVPEAIQSITSKPPTS